MEGCEVRVSEDGGIRDGGMDGRVSDEGAMTGRWGKWVESPAMFSSSSTV